MPTIKAVWRRIADNETIRRSSQPISVKEQAILLFGGEVKPRQPVDNKLYQISLNEQSPSQAQVHVVNSPSAPSARVGSASVSLNAKAYLFSGRGGEEMAPIEENGTFHVLDMYSARWTTLTPCDSSLPFPQARSYHALCSDGDKTIYLHAGCPESDRLSDLWAFNISQRKWTQLADAPAPPRGGTSIAHVNGKIYWMNGFDGKHEQGYALDIYDTSTDKWSTLTWTVDDGPSARSVSTLLPIKIDGRDVLITMFGESDPSNLGHQGAGKMLNDIWVYDLGSQKWTMVDADGDKPQARGWFAADVLREKSQVVVQGGLAEDNTRIGDVWTLAF